MASTAASLVRESGPLYFDSGSLTEREPMPQNPVHQLLLAVLFNNLCSTLMSRRDDVVVLCDVFWYDKRDPRPLAPDIGVAFGRPPVAERTAWFTDREAGVGFDFVIEVISPSDPNPLAPEHVASLPARYGRRGVQEYVEFHTKTGLLRIFERTAAGWGQVAGPWTWTSRLTGFHAVRLVPQGKKIGFSLEVEGLDGPYLRPEEVAAQAKRDAAQAKRDAAQAKRASSDVAAENQRLAAKLRELGIDPHTI